ncbi:MAG: cupin domain-containing protein [Gaiellaceae bacterium]
MIFRLEELEWVERDDGRRLARLSDGMTQQRANLWRLPPHTKGVRHLEKVQEEVFVVLEGRLTLMLGEPAEPVELGRGDAPAGAERRRLGASPLHLRRAARDGPGRVPRGRLSRLQ